MNAVEPTRSTRAGSAANAGIAQARARIIRRTLLHYPNSDVGAARSPDGGIGGTEHHQRRRANRGGQMANAGIVADVESGGGQPAGQLVEIVDVNGVLDGRVLGTGAPANGYDAFQLP